jgi:hypothetical protein
MPTETTEFFQKENIPDEDYLFYRIHKTKIDCDEEDAKKRIKLIAFDPQPKGSTEMSTDWNKYSTPADAQNRARIPSDNGIVSFLVDKVRNKPYSLIVEHDPTLDEHFKNQAHAVIKDVPPRVNDIGIRLKLRDICEWEIMI